MGSRGGVLSSLGLRGLSRNLLAPFRRFFFGHQRWGPGVWKLLLCCRLLLALAPPHLLHGAQDQ